MTSPTTKISVADGVAAVLIVLPGVLFVPAFAASLPKVFGCLNSKKFAFNR